MAKTQISVNLEDRFIAEAEKIARDQRRSLSNLLAVAIYEFFDWKAERLKEEAKKEDGK